jgi:4-alpha-glucanotransferase
MKPLRENRSSGILLHPTSLPGPFGIGDIGPAAYHWIDLLARAKQTWWQILPLGPTGYGDSPYQCFSAFAGNPYLISPEMLERDGLLRSEDLHGHHFQDDTVEYADVIPFKVNLLRTAWDRFRSGAAANLKEPFEQFCAEKKDWLDDYGLFMALKDVHRLQSWLLWPRELMRRDGDNKVVDFARHEMTDEVGFHQFVQFLFFRQWGMLRDYARAHGISIIGDVPIFVSGDSADVWSNTKLFLFDAAMRPKVVAGVPPDYFSPTGQLWGNPLYDWEAMKANRYQWWVARMRATFEMVDLVRLDHFRGFCAAWHVPAEDETAVHGTWVPGPGKELFEALTKQLGKLPLIAEDLGEITEDVYNLRDDYKFPGMKILQFAFDTPTNPFQPHNYTQNCVVYTGTHDNDTTRGWFNSLDDGARWQLGRYLNRDLNDVTWNLIRLAWASSADYAIVPLQDVFDLPTEARMNFPGKPAGNWHWRMRHGQFQDWMIDRLADMTYMFARVPKVNVEANERLKKG